MTDDDIRREAADESADSSASDPAAESADAPESPPEFTEDEKAAHAAELAAEAEKAAELAAQAAKAAELAAQAAKDAKRAAALARGEEPEEDEPPKKPKQEGIAIGRAIPRPLAERAIAGAEVEPATEHPPGYEPVDPHSEMLRSLPRLRSIEDPDLNGIEFVAPPPMISRVGGLAQGCGGLLLAIMGSMMLLVSLWFGYYMWGPGLILIGGIALLVGSTGVWAGRKTPLALSIAIIAGLMIVAYFWQSFIPAAGALSPVGAIGVFLAPASMLVALILVASLLSHAAALAYWRRLKDFNQRSLIIWVGSLVMLVAAVFALNYYQQRIRAQWLDDQLDTWTAEARTDTLRMGSNANVTLGYSFVTVEASDDSRLDIREAEFAAGTEAGVSVMRLSASGDLLFEAELERMFPVDEDAEDYAEQQQKAADRLVRQAEAEAEYMQIVADSGIDLLLSDAQYSPYLLVWSGDKDEDFTWEDFSAVQQQRIEHYAALYQPTYYEIINEPQAYGEFSGIDEDEETMLDRWVAQAEALIAMMNEISPDTKLGITINLSSDFDLDFYSRALEIEGIDFIGVRIFQQAAFERLEEILAERGHPVDFGKELWITETWFGYCLAPQRSMELDGDWLAVTAAFAARTDISAVFASDYGCFVQKGGTLFHNVDDLDHRTAVWRSWQEVVATWQ